MTILQLLTHTPVWVFALLAGLIALGLLQTRARTVSLSALLAPSLVLTAWSAYSVHAAFPAVPIAMFSWLGGVVLAQLINAWVPKQPAAEGVADDGRLSLRGSWLPLALMLTMFAVKYWAGVSIALEPLRATETAFASTLGAVYGLLGGLFLSRLLRTLQFVRHHRAAQAARAQAVRADPSRQVGPALARSGLSASSRLS